MLEKEKDPSVLSAPYAGKLTRYVVEDGAHLTKGDAYAEVEVRTMCMRVCMYLGCACACGMCTCMRR